MKQLTIAAALFAAAMAAGTLAHATDLSAQGEQYGECVGTHTNAALFQLAAAGTEISRNSVTLSVLTAEGQCEEVLRPLTAALVSQGYNAGDFRLAMHAKVLTIELTLWGFK